MNKCNFCVCSIPTGQMNAWKCSKDGDYLTRKNECAKAIETMKKYNEMRAKSSPIK